MNNTEEFRSQMTFLKSYEEQFKHRKEVIAGLKNRIEELQPYVDEYEGVNEKIEELKDQNKSDEKFLISMNEMVLRNTGSPISEGPLFDSSERPEEKAA